MRQLMQRTAGRVSMGESISSPPRVATPDSQDDENHDKDDRRNCAGAASKEANQVEAHIEAYDCGGLSVEHKLPQRVVSCEPANGLRTSLVTQDRSGRSQSRLHRFHKSTRFSSKAAQLGLS